MPNTRNHLQPRRTRPLPVSARTLEEVLVSRRQSQSIISAYESSRPPLEMLELDAERKRNARLAKTGLRNPDYPGVTPGMMRSMSAGVLRFGGVKNVGGGGGGQVGETLPSEM